MTKAYLLLLNIIDNKHIYVNHKLRRFKISYSDREIIIKCEDIKDFITIFNEDKDTLLEKLNITQ